MNVTLDEKLLRTFCEEASSRRFGYCRWLNTDNMRIYVRASRRFVENEVRRTLELANVEVENKGKGFFTAYLTRAEDIAKEFGLCAIIVECVHNRRLVSFLRKRGYNTLNSDGAPTLYKIIIGDEK